jgi:hypothetical protein
MQFAGRDVVARKELGGYWKNAMNSQAMPDAIKGRIHPQTAGKGVHFAKDFNTDTNVANHNNGWHKQHPVEDLIHPEAENSPISKPKP